MLDTPRVARVAPLNPLRFIVANDYKQPLYNTWKFDHGFFYQQLARQQTPSVYIQKCMPNDIVNFYMDSTALSCTMQVIDCHNNIILDDEYVPFIGTVAGNVYTDAGGTEYLYNTFYKEFKFSDYSIPDGIYYIVVQMLFDGETVSTYKLVSEPIFLRAKGWPRTMLMEYGHSINRYDVMFEKIEEFGLTYGRLPFNMRAELFLDAPEPASSDTVFRNVNRDLINLNSDPYRRRELMIGGGVGVPAYVIEKVARALACDTNYLDNTRVIKDEATLQLTTVKNENNQLRTASIFLQEKEEQNNWVFELPNAAIILEIPTDEEGNRIYPFAVTYIYLSNITTTMTVPAFVVDSDAELTTLINNLNSVFVPAHGATGSFMISDDNTLYYNNGIGERYSLLPGTVVFTYFISYYRGDNADNYLSLYISALTDRFSTVLDYGNGGVRYLSGDTVYLFQDMGDVVSDQNIRIFHSGDDLNPDLAIGRLEVNAGAPSYMKNFEDAHNPRHLLPSGMYHFGATYCFGYGSIVDTRLLRSAKDTLRNIYFFNNGGALSTIFLNAIFDVFGGSGDYFSVINNVQINLRMNTSMVNAIVLAFEANTSISYSGIFFIQTTGGGNPPTGAALAFLDSLVSDWGWTVVHD